MVPSISVVARRHDKNRDCANAIAAPSRAAFYANKEKISRSNEFIDALRDETRREKQKNVTESDCSRFFRNVVLLLVYFRTSYFALYCYFTVVLSFELFRYKIKHTQKRSFSISRK